MTSHEHQESIIIAGFGGQGVVLAGKLLAQAALCAGLQVTYFPSYGAEVRGGTSNCTVVISHESIASPVIARPDCLIIMNQASCTKFLPQLKENGLLIFNCSSIKALPPHTPAQIRRIAIDADEQAIALGNQRVANMILLGAYLKARGLLDLNAVKDVLPQVLAPRYHHMLSTNIRALYKGAELASPANVPSRV